MDFLGIFQILWRRTLIAGIGGYGGAYSPMYYGHRGSNQGVEPPEPAKIQQVAFSQMDTNGDGSIDKGELTVAFKNVSSSEENQSIASIDKLFTQLDSNGDGGISQEESGAALRREQEQFQARTSGERSMMGGMRPSPPEVMGKRELLGTMDGMAGAGPPPRPGMADAMGNSRSDLQAQKELFSLLDTNGDGSIDQSELAVALNGESSGDQNGIFSEKDSWLGQADSSGAGRTRQNESVTVNEKRSQEQRLSSENGAYSSLVASVLQQYQGNRFGEPRMSLGSQLDLAA